MIQERSVDGDVLLYLCKKLLRTHPTIKIVLMSATIHTDLYRHYFSQDNDDYGDMTCLSVGARRFPLNILHVEDIILLANNEYPPTSRPPFELKLPKVLATLADKIRSDGKALKNNAISQNFVKNQYTLALSLIKSIAVDGTGILVFVSGIADITELSEKFESLSRFKVVAIHSDIPFEEQESAFLPAEPNQVKVIIATNAAEVFSFDIMFQL